MSERVYKRGQRNVTSERISLRSDAAAMFLKGDDKPKAGGLFDGYVTIKLKHAGKETECLTLAKSETPTKFTAENPAALLDRLIAISEEEKIPVDTWAVDTRFKDHPKSALALIAGKWGVPRLSYHLSPEDYREATGKARVSTVRRWND